MMKRMKMRIMGWLLIGILCILSIGCSKQKNSLIGEWETEDGKLQIAFYESGDYNWSGGTGTYEVLSDSEIKLIRKHAEEVTEYSVEGDTLVMDMGYNGEITFYRK